MSIKLICLDLDGTCITYDQLPGVLHPEAITLLNKLKEEGVAWSINSGRSWEDEVDILEVSRKHGLNHDPVALMSRESIIHFLKDGTYQEHQQWNDKARTTLVAFHAAFQAELAADYDDLMVRYEPVETYVGPEGTAFCIPSDKDPELPQKFFDEVYPYVQGIEDGGLIRNGGWIAALPDSLGKGCILNEVMGLLGFSSHEVLAVGDHMNDCCMLDGSSAGHVGCPGNAHEAVKQQVANARGIIGQGDGGLGTVDVINRYLAG